MGKRAALATVLLAGALGASTPARAHPGLSRDIDSVTARIRDAPNDVALRVYRADRYRRLGHMHDAIVDLRVVFRHEPDHAGALLTRALIRIGRGQPKKALRDLDRALAQPNAPSDTWAVRARLHDDAGHYAEARRDYSTAAALRPRPDYFLARARLDAAAQQWDAALDGLRQGVAAAKGAVVLRVQLAKMLQASGDRAGAQAEVAALMVLAPTRVDWVLWHADLLAEQDLQQRASAERLRALALAVAAVARRPSANANGNLQATYDALQRSEPLK